jgi:hypothetical protein
MCSKRYSCRSLIKLQFSRQIFEKHSNVKFNENPCSVNCVALCRETDKRSARRTDEEVTKLTVAFRNLVHVPKKYLMRISRFVPFFSFFLFYLFKQYSSKLFPFLYTFCNTPRTVRPLAMPPPATLFS